MIHSLSFLLLFLLLLLSTPTWAWWCDGHMAIAQVARSQMSADTLAYVDTALKQLYTDGPFIKNPDMVQMACWADDIKEHDSDLHVMESWHFINQPYSPDGTAPTAGVIQQENVASLIHQFEETLKHKTSWYVLTFSLANLIHFFGDSHQPLHVIEEFSKVYPRGEGGGNFQKVNVNGTWTTLHFIWDSVCWQFSTSAMRPLSTQDEAKLVAYANYLMATYTFTESQMAEYNATVYVQEGYADAIKYAYPTITNGTVVTDAYLQRCRPVAEARLALAGYRLGRQLEYVLRDVKGKEPRDVARKILHHTLTHVQVARQHSRNLQRGK